MKLISISFGTVPRLPGLRPSETGHIDCDRPSDSLKNWKLALRGASIFFISPPGWSRDQSTRRGNEDPKGPSTVYGPIPLRDVYLEWQSAPEEIETLLSKTNKWDSPPFGWTPTPVAADKSILEQIPAGQMGDA